MYVYKQSGQSSNVFGECVYADIHIMLECDKCTGTMYYINIDIKEEISGIQRAGNEGNE